jgi:hypothetical protein
VKKEADADIEDEDSDEVDALGNKKASVDPVKLETLNILTDLIDLTRGTPKKETASTIPSAIPAK